MAQVEARKLELEKVVPAFTLPSLKGDKIGPWDYKQKRNLVIAYLDLNHCSTCMELLRELADNYRTYENLETEILFVTPLAISDARAKVGTMGLPFPVLSDEQGEVGRVYLGSDPGKGPAGGIFVADRFGALRYQAVASTERDFPSQASILDWLTLIEMECPECGDSEWPVT